MDIRQNERSEYFNIQYCSRSDQKKKLSGFLAVGVTVCKWFLVTSMCHGPVTWIVAFCIL